MGVDHEPSLDAISQATSRCCEVLSWYDTNRPNRPRDPDRRLRVYRWPHRSLTMVSCRGRGTEVFGIEEIALDGSDRRWLDETSNLRLDATVESFPESRRLFHLERYRFASERTRGQRVLDAACGTGYGSSMLGRVAKEVVGVDLSLESIEYARRHHGSERVSFRHAPVEFLPFPSGSFDGVTCFETLEHTLSPRRTVAELARVVDGEGTVVLSVPNLWGETPNHFTDFDVDRLSELLGPFFDNYELYYQNSGDWKNRYPKGIGELRAISPERAECLIAVCSRPRGLRENDEDSDRLAATFAELYSAALAEHQLKLLYEKRCAPFARLTRAWRRRWKKL